MGCTAMLRSLRIVPPLVCLLLAGVPAFAAVDGRPCPAEPSDINMTYGDMVTDCRLDAIGDTDVVRFVGSAGEVIRLRVVTVSGTGTPCITFFDPQGRGIQMGGNSCGGSSLYATSTLALSGSHTVVIGERNTMPR